MSAPDPQPPTHARAPRGPSAVAMRNGCVWLVLILLTGAAVVQTVADAHPNGWNSLARAAPHALASALVHAVIGFAIGAFACALLPRGAVWIVLAVALVALYPAARQWGTGGRAPTHVWMWVPFSMLLGMGVIVAIPVALREAAAVDRAGRWFAFRTITLPLAAPLLIIGAVFLMAAALYPIDARGFVVAHVLLILAIAVDALVARSRP